MDKSTPVPRTNDSKTEFKVLHQPLEKTPPINKNLENKVVLAKDEDEGKPTETTHRQDLSLEESGCALKVKRFLLLIPLGVILCSRLLDANFFYSVIFLSPASFISFWIIFTNFPYFAGWLHTEPLYVEDLQIPNQKKQRFLWWYTHITNFFLALVMMGVMDYTFAIQKKHHKTSAVEICGTIGGILALYLKIESVIAKLILFITYKWKKHTRVPVGPLRSVTKDHPQT